MSISSVSFKPNNTDILTRDNLNSKQENTKLSQTKINQIYRKKHPKTTSTLNNQVKLSEGNDSNGSKNNSTVKSKSLTENKLDTYA